MKDWITPQNEMAEILQSLRNAHQRAKPKIMLVVLNDLIETAKAFRKEIQSEVYDIES